LSSWSHSSTPSGTADQKLCKKDGSAQIPPASHLPGKGTFTRHFLTPNSSRRRFMFFEWNKLTSSGSLVLEKNNYSA